MFKDKLYSLILNNDRLKAASPKVSAVGRQVKHAYPEIALVGGLAAGLAAGVTAVKAARKHEEVLGRSREELIVAIEEAHDSDKTSPEKFQSVAPYYGDYAGTWIRLYGPSIALGGLSLYLLLSSHGVLRGRNKALLAAATILEQSYSAYREKVRDAYGDDVDDRFYHGFEQKTVSEPVVSEGGKKSKKRKKVNAMGEEVPGSMYARVFDASSPEFSSDRGLNKFYLETVEAYANDILRITGYLLLNDVYRHLHIPETPEGAVVGWSLAASGDNFVDFGLDRPVNSHVGDNRFYLDFNVNGVVYEYIGAPILKDV